jgi:hypothetical protein
MATRQGLTRDLSRLPLTVAAYLSDSSEVSWRAYDSSADPLGMT